MSENENLLLRLRQGVSGYSPTQQKLGSFILNDPSKVLYLTITELARESNTSEASVTRLCRTLGCKGYTEFKMALALDVQREHVPVKKGDEIDEIVEESILALQDTSRLLDREIFRAPYTSMAWRQAPLSVIICTTNCFVSASRHSYLAICIVLR